MLPPGAWTWSLVTAWFTRLRGKPTSWTCLAFPLKEHLSFIEVIYSCGFIMDWWLILERCWRESSGMRTNPAEFCANFRPNVVVILETDKSNTWHKKANKNRDLWQITATHLPSLAGARVQSDKLIMRNSMELQNVTLCWLINFPLGPSFKQAYYTHVNLENKERWI